VGGGIPAPLRRMPQSHPQISIAREIARPEWDCTVFLLPMTVQKRAVDGSCEQVSKKKYSYRVHDRLPVHSSDAIDTLGLICHPERK